MGFENQRNEVIRVRKLPSQFVTMHKGFLENSSLSFKAKGVLAYLLSKPDNWKVIMADLNNSSTDGKAAIYSALRELKAAGYYEKVPVRTEDGKLIDHWESIVYEVPKDEYLLTDFQQIDNQQIENQFLENRERNNNYINNNNINNNHVMSVGNRRDVTEPIVDKPVDNYVDNSIGGSADNMTTIDPSPAKLTVSIRKQIDYQEIQAERPSKAERKLLDEFIDVMVDCMTTISPAQIRVSGEVKRRDHVVQQLWKVDKGTMMEAIDRYCQTGNRVKKKRNYMLSTLYSATMESGAGLANSFRVGEGRSMWG